MRALQLASAVSYLPADDRPEVFNPLVTAFLEEANSERGTVVPSEQLRAKNTPVLEIYYIIDNLYV